MLKYLVYLDHFLPIFRSCHTSIVKHNVYSPESVDSSFEQVWNVRYHSIFKLFKFDEDFVDQMKSNVNSNLSSMCHNLKICKVIDVKTKNNLHNWYTYNSKDANITFYLCFVCDVTRNLMDIFSPILTFELFIRGLKSVNDHVRQTHLVTSSHWF